MKNLSLPVSKIKRFTVRTAVALGLSLLSMGEASAYTFTKIADTTSGSYSSFLGIPPAINNKGTVVFFAKLDGEREGVFTGNGTTTTTIADTSGVFSSFSSYPSINDAGTVAFAASLNDGIDGEIPSSVGIFTSNGTTVNTITTIRPQGFNSKYDYISLDFPSINNAGALAFRQKTNYTNTILTNDGITLDQVVIGQELIQPIINDAGTVTYIDNNTAGNGESTIVANDGTNKTVIGDTTGVPRMSNFIKIGSTEGGFSLNNKGTVAFYTVTYGSTGFGVGNGIFTSNGTTRTTIADISGPFSSLSTPWINDAGTVVFLASLNQGGQGIFTGPDSLSNKVISTGDSLFGSTVTSLSFGRGSKGLNNSGQITFLAQLANGTSGIFRADPDAPPIPNPISQLALAPDKASQ